MLTIKVLGPGCENCKKVEATARKAVATMGLEAQIEKVTDYAAIHKYPILATPGLVINEKAGLRRSHPHRGGSHYLAGQC